MLSGFNSIFCVRLFNWIFDESLNVKLERFCSLKTKSCTSRWIMAVGSVLWFYRSKPSRQHQHTTVILDNFCQRLQAKGRDGIRIFVAFFAIGMYLLGYFLPSLQKRRCLSSILYSCPSWTISATFIKTGFVHLDPSPFDLSRCRHTPYAIEFSTCWSLCGVDLCRRAVDLTVWWQQWSDCSPPSP